MKIAIASSGLGHVARGIEAWAADLGRALVERGESVTVWKGGGRAEAEFERVIPCWQRESLKAGRLLSLLPRWLGWRLGLGSGYGIEQTTFALRLLAHLRREEIDILHVQDPQVALIVQRARQLGGMRTRVILAHGTEETLRFQSRITYLQHLAPWHLDAARAASVWRPSWTAIPNFIDTGLFHPGRSATMRAELGIPPEALVVLSVAAIKKQHKRIDYLLDEFATLRDAMPQAPVWLVIAGGWEAETDELVRLGSERLGERVRFLVRFPRVRMPELYRAADIFALCSLKEMMPIALLEAASSGLTCLVNRHPVVEWMIGADQHGAIEMARPGALSRALESLLGNPTRLRESGERLRDYCEENFSRDRVVDRILEYYRFVLEHGRKSASAVVASGMCES